MKKLKLEEIGKKCVSEFYYEAIKKAQSDLFQFSSSERKKYIKLKLAENIPKELLDSDKFGDKEWTIILNAFHKEWLNLKPKIINTNEN